MNRKTILVITHFAGWLLGLSFVVSFIFSGSFGSRSFSGIVFSWPFLVFVLFYLLVFYLNEFVFMPIFFLKRRYLLYNSILLALLLITFYLKPFDLLLNANRTAPGFSQEERGRRPPPPSLDQPAAQQFPAGGPGFRQGHFDLVSIILFFCVWAISTILVISRQWRITAGNHAATRVEKANAELSFLKAQISPHFLFNTLNNIYSLAINKSDATPDGILRLSNIMRYVTDEAAKDFVLLKQELNCIEDFIALQQLRLSKNIQLHYKVDGNPDHVYIAPLMLMPFVENVFKHGIDNLQLTQLYILIAINDKEISLHTSNPLLENKAYAARNGVGLENVSKRLELIYPEQYNLSTKAENGSFVVDLKLKWRD